MTRDSLALRLALAAGLTSGAAFLLTGLLLTSLFTRTVERSFDQQLETLQAALVGALFADGRLGKVDAERVGEPRFALPQSGWYWQLEDLDRRSIVAASPSLIGETLRLGSHPGGGTARTIEGPGGQALRALSRQIVSPDEAAYRITVTGDADALRSDVSRFTRAVALSLGTLALLLSLSSVLLVRWGLLPLERLRWALHRVAKGQEKVLTGRYPREIMPLVDELNSLIRSNETIIERARTHAGNLAHGLKTPLAVLMNEAADGEGTLAETVRNQARAMREQVDHHLARARMASNATRLGAATDVEATARDIVRVMHKLQPEKIFSVECPEADIRFRGERHDLEEMIGNLVENAAKFAASRVVVRIEPEVSEAHLAVHVEDDGPGLDETGQKQALRRGVRLDEKTPGTGLGLSIVDDLAESYGGRLVLGRSSLGGLAAAVHLPRVVA